MFYSFPRNVGARRRRIPIAFTIAATMFFAGVARAQHDHAILSVPPTAMMTGAPVNATGGTPPLRFESVLSRYKPMTDQKLGSWREANDTVTRIGGWRTYLKEAQAPEVTESSVPAVPAKPATPPTANPHAGHGAKP